MDLFDNYIVKMDELSFAKLSSFISSEYGIKLPIEKKTMIETRLNKTYKKSGFKSYKEFVEFIFTPSGKNELLNVVDIVTTNKTDFFRENHHFEYLKKEFLPFFDVNSELKVWSSACSSGEEPYSILITLEEMKKVRPNLRYKIYASDISIRMLQAAVEGIYEEFKLLPISNELKRNYFNKSIKEEGIYRVKPEYRAQIKYKRINLIESVPFFGYGELDVVFCRNVLIYFPKAIQLLVLKKLCSFLKKDGLLFLGHSESIIGMDLPLKQISPTVYSVL